MKLSSLRSVLVQDVAAALFMLSLWRKQVRGGGRGEASEARH